MSFNKFLVPEPKKMIAILEEGVPEFFRRKIDAMIGNTVSMQMIDDAWGLYQLKIDEDEIIEKLRTKYKREIEKETNLM